MPKRKPTTGVPRSKVKSAARAGRKPKNKQGADSPRPDKTPRAELTRPTGSRGSVNEEYLEYLERYELYGEGRPRLAPAEFDRLDEEMLDLLAFESEQGVLNDDQIVRLQELEYLLLDSE